MRSESPDVNDLLRAQARAEADSIRNIEPAPQIHRSPSQRLCNTSRNSAR